MLVNSYNNNDYWFLHMSDIEGPLWKLGVNSFVDIIAQLRNGLLAIVYVDVEEIDGTVSPSSASQTQNPVEKSLWPFAFYDLSIIVW